MSNDMMFLYCNIIFNKIIIIHFYIVRILSARRNVLQLVLHVYHPAKKTLTRGLCRNPMNFLVDQKKKKKKNPN